MPRFTQMLAKGMKERGHNIELWAPQSQFYNVPAPDAIKKWLRYIDQYIVFPKQMRAHIRKCTLDTLVVFTDQALGPWVPLVANRLNVIHCPDFLAQRSAMCEIKENKTGWFDKKISGFYSPRLCARNKFHFCFS
jgi:hypothetical protein